jgi:macrolide transport system ATP-binding/permease protein
MNASVMREAAAGAVSGARSVATPVIQMHDIRKSYLEGSVELPVLRGIDMAVMPGEIVALLGPSGCGKSTLLNLMGCLDHPSSGRYLLGGRDVSGLTRQEQAWVRLHYIGFVFQSFHLIGHATALENVALPLYYAGVPRGEREARAEALLQRVGLGERLHHRPDQLSGLRAETHLTIVLVTHDLEVAKVAGRRFEMRDGQIIHVHEDREDTHA